MSCCDNQLTVAQGTTYVFPVYRYSQPPYVYKPIAALVAATPLTLTVTAHGIPNGWPFVAFVDVTSMPLLSANTWPLDDDSEDYHDATMTDANTLQFNDIDGGSLGTYTSGGLVAYLTPVDLAGCSAAMKIYAHPAPSPLVAALTLTGALDNTAKTITFSMSAVQSAALAVGEYTFAVDFINAAGAVILLDSDSFSIFVAGVDESCR